MSDDPKAVVTARLLKMGNAACDVYEELLERPGRNAGVRFAVAREVVNAIRGYVPADGEGDDDEMSVDELVAVRAKLKAARQG